MDDLLSADWGRLIAGAGIILALLVLLRVVVTAFNWALRTYRASATFDADRLSTLESQVEALNVKVDAALTDYREQRGLKHDWKNFATSLIQERWTIRRFAVVHNCAEVIELMDQLDELRNDHPLMSDVTTMLKGDLE